MTTYADSYQREDAAPDFHAQIMTIEQTLAQADPQMAQTLTDEAGIWLGSLYEEAERTGDANAMLAISEAWTRLQTVNQSAAVNNAAARAALAGMQTATEQRDAIADEHTRLVEAVIHIDADHPLVETLIEEVEEANSEWMYDQAYEEAFEAHREDMARTLTRNLPGMATDEAHWLISTLLAWRSDQITTDEIDQLIAFLEATRARLAQRAG